MKRVLVFTLTLIVTATGLAFAQSPQSPPLAEVARAEEARRKTAKKAKMVFTNANLADVDTLPPPASAGGSATPMPSPPPTISGGGDDEAPAASGEKKDQKYWQTRMATAREDLERTKMFAESMQTRINSLQNDIFNLDYPARGVAEKQRAGALAELERLKKEIDAKTKGIAAIEEEARRSGVPAGWLRQ
jgi:hypothetical protein